MYIKIEEVLHRNKLYPINQIYNNYTYIISSIFLFNNFNNNIRIISVNIDIYSIIAQKVYAFI